MVTHTLDTNVHLGSVALFDGVNQVSPKGFHLGQSNPGDYIFPNNYGGNKLLCIFHSRHATHTWYIEVKMNQIITRCDEGVLIMNLIVI